MDCNTTPYTNALPILTEVSNGGGDPIYDAYDENIGNGNNSAGVYAPTPPNTIGAQPPTQTTLPKPIPEVADASNNTPPPENNDGVDVKCGSWDGKDYNVQLSPHFKLADFTTKALYPHNIPTGDVFGFSMQTRFCNLKALATNVGESIFNKFGMPRINSGLRNDNSSKGVSQHVKGEAMDLQWPGWDYAKYWDNAQWIVNNVPFDQFIYEHSSTTGLVWYHLSFSRTGNRPASNRDKVMTMYRNNYSPGLHRYG